MDPVVLQEETWTKLPAGSIAYKLFFLKDSLIHQVLLLEKT